MVSSPFFISRCQTTNRPSYKNYDRNKILIGIPINLPSRQVVCIKQLKGAASYQLRNH